MNRLSKSIQISISLFFLLCSNISTIQAKGSHLLLNQDFFYSFEGFIGHGNQLSSNYVINTTAFSSSSYGVKVSANWFFNYHLSGGVGLGLLNYEEPGMFTFPLLINSQAYLNKGSNTPLVYAEAGYGLRFNHKNQDKGFLYELGVGYRHRIKWKNCWVVKVGYRGFKNNQWIWKRKMGDSIDPMDPYCWYYLKRQTITFTIGYYFSTRH